ncbi:MAG: class I SAM-dependent methyltransferase [Mycobacterium sp.]
MIQRISDGMQDRLSRAWVTARPWSKESIEIRLRTQAEMLREFVRPGETLLDIGCGLGFMSQNLHDMFGVAATGMDIQDYREAQIPFQEFDGITIPFPDKSFDHIMLSFTLHHSHDPKALIEECLRVVRRSIIFFEDIPHTWIGRKKVIWHVESFRKQFRIELPRSDEYRNVLDWLGTKSIRVYKTRMPFEWFDLIYVPRYLLVYTLSQD